MLELAPDLPRLRVERIQIQQVLLNLLRSSIDALEAVPPERRQMFIRSAADEAGDILITVTDSGPGVHAICDQQIQWHRTGTCDQPYDCGSSWGSVGLPAQQALGRRVCREASSRTGTSSVKEPAATVFVIDDDDAVRSSLRMLLKSVGLPVQVCASAQQFLPGYDPRLPGCLVLDVRMPSMSGLELQQQLNMRGAAIPVVFITGHGDIPMVVEAMQHGAFDFLQKPFRDQDLIDRVQRALERDAANRAQLKQIDTIRSQLESLTPREHQVLELEMMGESRDFEVRRTRFEAAVQAYVTAYLDHIRLEETEVLPLAERLFTERDWAELDDAFMKNRDPLTYRDGEDEFRPLFKRILMTLPAPLGLGPATEALGDSYPRTP